MLEPNNGNGQYIPLSSLSSGEKQKLTSFSAIIYHLRNLENHSSESKGYENVNIMLEEIELYFHPECQRGIIKSLISMIEGCHFRNIKNINLLFVTHSPFVLSDIPKRNVLFLKDGKPDMSMQENTFGANIHSMLKNGFFLPNLPMGDFAYHKIDTLFKKFNTLDFTEDELDKMYQEIKLVGEPYLRKQLLELYHSCKCVDRTDILGLVERYTESRLRLEREKIKNELKSGK